MRFFRDEALTILNSHTENPGINSDEDGNRHANNQ